MSDPNEAMKAMARRVAAETKVGAAAADILSGMWDESPLVRAVLATIMETQETIASWLEQYPTPMNDLDMAMRIRDICAAIRAGEHYAPAGDRHGRS